MTLYFLYLCMSEKFMIKIFKKIFKKHIDVSKTQVYTVNRDHNSTNSKMNESEEFYYEIKRYGTYSTRVEGHGQ